MKEKKPVRAVPTAPRVEARSGGAGGYATFRAKRRFRWCVTRFVTPRDDAFEYTNTTTLYTCDTVTDRACFVCGCNMSFLRAERFPLPSASGSFSE